ncbi:DNA-3-methyladenine glycosylase I [Entomobacter blattae]|uniref:DNA-3-methyladenine glycosylase 1 n=1 Tax=Entomobacter blattae TaxID=2762277 RepID=A0A7H1NTL3_9PROT|nr:DNA-3-methyladenine glycosylase I [Entomobacter blattae]QNT79123.1 DNA-3-methyladenine glycosylase 1 [Entomobacter blattae]
MNRCQWVGDDALMQHYHDTEWGIPIFDDRALWENLILEGFQAGLSWKIVLHKRENFRNAFYDFFPEKILAMKQAEKAALLTNPGIIRSKLKIESVFQNAQAFIDLQEKGSGLSDLAWHYTNHKPHFCFGKPDPSMQKVAEKLSKDLKKLNFKFVGPTIVYAWMQAIGLINDHEANCSALSLKEMSKIETS